MASPIVLTTTGLLSTTTIPVDWADSSAVVHTVGPGGNGAAGTTGTSGNGGGGGAGGSWAQQTAPGLAASQVVNYFIGAAGSGLDSWFNDRQLIRSTDNLNSTGWSLTAATATSGQADPDAGTGAWRLAASTSNVQHNILNGGPRLPSLAYSTRLAVTVKPTVAGYGVQIAIRAYETGNRAFMTVDLDNTAGGGAGAFSTGVNNAGVLTINAASGVTSLGNGWYQVVLVCDWTNTDTSVDWTPEISPMRYVAGAWTDTYAGDGSNGLYLYQPQFNYGSQTRTFVANTSTTVGLFSTVAKAGPNGSGVTGGTAASSGSVGSSVFYGGNGGNSGATRGGGGGGGAAGHIGAGKAGGSVTGSFGGAGGGGSNGGTSTVGANPTTTTGANGGDGTGGTGHGLGSASGTGGPATSGTGAGGGGGFRSATAATTSTGGAAAADTSFDATHGVSGGGGGGGGNSATSGTNNSNGGAATAGWGGGGGGAGYLRFAGGTLAGGAGGQGGIYITYTPAPTAATAAAANVTTAAGVGRDLAIGAAAGPNVTTASATGFELAIAAGAAPNTTTAAATGGQLGRAAAAAPNVTGAAATGRTLATGVGSAAGASAVSGEGPATGTGAGVGGAAGQGQEFAVGQGAAANITGAAGAGQWHGILSPGTGAAANVTTAAATGQWTGTVSTGTGAAPNTTTAAATGQWVGTVSTGTGAAANATGAAATGRTSSIGAGNAATVTTATGLGGGANYAAASGVGTASGVGQWQGTTSTATAAAAGVGAAAGTGTWHGTLSPGTGVAAGLGMAAATGQWHGTVSSATAAAANATTAAGIGTSHGTSNAGTGAAAGLGTAAGTGTSHGLLNAGTGVAAGIGVATGAGAGGLRALAASSTAAGASGQGREVAVAGFLGPAIGAAAATGHVLIRGLGVAASAGLATGFTDRTPRGTAIAVGQSGVDGFGLSVTVPADFSFPLVPPGGFLCPAAIAAKSVNRTVSAQSPYSLLQEFADWGVERHEWEVTLPPLDKVEGGRVVAFLEALRGGAGTFLYGNPKKSRPRGVASSLPAGNASIGDMGQTLTPYELPIVVSPASIGVIPRYLAVGDHLSLGTLTDRRLYRVTADVTLTSGLATVNVWPRLRGRVVRGDPVSIYNATGLFRLGSAAPQHDVDVDGFYAVGKVPIIEVVNAEAAVAPPSIVRQGTAQATGSGDAAAAAFRAQRGVAQATGSSTATGSGRATGRPLAGALAMGVSVGTALGNILERAFGTAAATSTAAAVRVAAGGTTTRGVGNAVGSSLVTGVPGANSIGNIDIEGTLTSLSIDGVGWGPSGSGATSGNIVIGGTLDGLSIDGIAWGPGGGAGSQIQTVGVGAAQSLSVASAANRNQGTTARGTGSAAALSVGTGRGQTTTVTTGPSPPAPVTFVGAGDSLSTVQSKINSAGANGSVVFPSGYTIGGSLNGRSNITLWADGPVTVNGDFNFANQQNWTVRGKSYTNGFNFNGHRINATTANGFTIGNCVFNNAPQNAYDGTAVQLNNASNGLIINNDFNACSGNVLGMYHWDAIAVDGCHFIDCGQCLSVHNNTPGADDNKGNNITIRRSVFLRSSYATIEIGPTENGYWQHFNGLVVEDNFFDDWRYTQDPNDPQSHLLGFSLVGLSATNTTVRNNFLRQGTNSGGAIGTNEFTGTGECYNNTFVGFYYSLFIYRNGANVHDNHLWQSNPPQMNDSSGSATFTNNTNLSSAPATPPWPTRIAY